MGEDEGERAGIHYFGGKNAARDGMAGHKRGGDGMG